MWYRAPPYPIAMPRARGRIITQPHGDAWVTKKWPKKIGRNRSPAVRQGMSDFAWLQQSLKHTAPQEVAQAIADTHKTGWYPRDALMAAAYGNYIKWSYAPGGEPTLPAFPVPSPIRNINHLIKLWEIPCAIPPMIWIETAIPALCKLMFSYLAFSPNDILFQRAGRHFHHGLNKLGKGIRAAQPEIDAGGKKMLWKLLEIPERILYWYFVADLLTEFAANWTSLAYEASLCNPLYTAIVQQEGGSGLAVPEGDWGFIYPLSYIQRRGFHSGAPIVVYPALWTADFGLQCSFSPIFGSPEVAIRIVYGIEERVLAQSEWSPTKVGEVTTLQLTAGLGGNEFAPNRVGMQCRARGGIASQQSPLTVVATADVY